MSDAVLEIKNLNVDYGLGDQAVHAVRDVNLTLHKGEVLGLAGESGSGKSTLAYGLTRLLAPPGVITGGEVIYHPEDGEAYDVLKLSDAGLRKFRWAETAKMTVPTKPDAMMAVRFGCTSKRMIRHVVSPVARDASM